MLRLGMGDFPTISSARPLASFRRHIGGIESLQFIGFRGVTVWVFIKIEEISIRICVNHAFAAIQEN